MSSTCEYPSPTIVVGVGRLGLAVLERVGEDWESLAQATDDASLKNLRLLHIRADDGVDEDAWRGGERQFAEIARYTGDGDLPSLALHFVILRSLGLIRYHDGTYQVAIPRDAGVVEVPPVQAGDAVEADDVDEDLPEADFARRRYFDWKNLSPDPVTSVERLRVLASREPEIDLFITPLLNRILHGHSPRAVLACISRCRALAEGRDPWPFSWLFRPLVEGSAVDEASASEPLRRVPFDGGWLETNDARGFLDGMAEEPLTGWSKWVRELDAGPGPIALGDLQPPDGNFDLSVPSPFMPQASDLAAPIDPLELLKVDWQATGWATRKFGDLGAVEFEPVCVSPFRLGLFDHDAFSRVHQTRGETFRGRLRELAIHAHRGLVRMWVDLQRERVESSSDDYEVDRRRESVDDALGQSLEVLGELLVRPLLTDRDRPAGGEQVAARAASDSATRPRPGRDDEVDLPDSASSVLRELVVEEPPPENAARHALDARLAELGFDPPQASVQQRMLFSDVTLQPRDLQEERAEHSAVDPDLTAHQAPGLLELRNLLNERTRQLFDFNFLKKYRDRPMRNSPRLTIYVVCDMTEAFSRATIRRVLREIHAELLRAYGPIFETYREGFDRALSVVPIIWMPHPADRFGGRHPLQNRLEEAAIIEAIQGVRRWVESVPRGKRCVGQVIINSRVTDNAVLSVWDSVRQTRDFLNFQVRNDLSGDEWLRRTATGTRGDDFFASFSCHEIEFPAERGREYLANRYARHSIRRIRDGEHGPLPEVDGEPIEPPQVDDLVAEPAEQLGQETGRAAQRLSGAVDTRIAVSAATTVDEVEGRFDDAFEAQLLEKIQRQWTNFTRRRGEMDEMVDTLRRDTSQQLADTLDVVRETGDRLIEEHASQGGLKRANAGFGELHALARARLRQREGDRRQKEGLCLEHRIPQTSGVGSARRSVLAAGRDKPDDRAMNTGMLIWALMAPALGAPLVWALAKSQELHLEPNAVEFVLGPLGPLVGALLVLAPVVWLLRRHMHKHVEQLEEAIESMAAAARRVVDGGSAALSSAPSIRSFMEARLVHTASLATRSFARQVYARVLRDLELAGRLRRSVDLQHDVLMRRAEDLGVRVQMADLDADQGQDDVSELFDSRSHAPIDKLIEPHHLLDYYARHVGGDSDVDAMLARFIEEVGGFEHWRRVASLSDTDRILGYARSRFDELVDEPVSNQFVFEDKVRQRLLDFVLANYSNIGFGAKFIGYEGLDPDGVDILAKTALVLHPALEAVFEEGRLSPEAASRLQTLSVQSVKIQPNAAYMLSLAQGIRPHSVRNLRRFESFHHRPSMPDGRTFAGAEQDGDGAPINHLTGYDSLRSSLNRGVFDIARDIEPDLDSPADAGGGDE